MDLKTLIKWSNSQPLRFLVVGAWNFVFGYFAFAGLYWAMNGRWPDWLISTIAAILGITMSYLTHRFITYRSHGCWWREYLRFYVVYGGESILYIFLILVLFTPLQIKPYNV